MEGYRGIDEMEESWQDFASEDTSNARESVLLTGQEAYLRTKQMLDEATTASNTLFVDEEDMSHRYRKAYEREDAPDAISIAGDDRMNGRQLSAPFRESSSFFFQPGDGGVSQGGGGDFLASAAGGVALMGAVERRPEEKLFCDAFVDLQALVQRLPPGERARPNQIGPIVQNMYNYCWDAGRAAGDTTARLRELQGSGSPAAATAAETAHNLSLEKDTWALLLMMSGVDQEDAEIKEEMQRDEEERGVDDAPIFAPPGPNASDKEMLDLMRTRDPDFRRTEAAVEWLQDAMNDRLESLAPAEGVFRGGALGWSQTLESLAAGGGQKSEVAQMHPDANLKKLGSRNSSSSGVNGMENALQVLQLSGQDDLDEEELLRTVWVLLRAGKLRRAKAMCEDRGQPWRAAAMAGGGVVGCRKEGNGEEDGAVYSPGQALWQEMCWKLSVSLERGANSCRGLARSVAQHEAAVFAHLAGNAELLLTSDLTPSWEDQAWIRFSALLQIKVVRERIRHRRSQAALSSLYPGVAYLRADERLLERMMRLTPPCDLPAIFELLDDTARGPMRIEGMGVYRQAQQALILGDEDVPAFLKDILRKVAGNGAGGSGAQDHMEGGDEDGGMTAERPRAPQLLRFAAHLASLLAALCPRLTIEDETLEAIEDVVCVYARHLAKTQQVQLVAVYAATLPVLRRRALYAEFLGGLNGEENRREALRQAKEHLSGDVSAILKKVVEDARLETTSTTTEIPREVPDGDRKKIEAMSWLLGDPQMRAEGIEQANALARHLLLQTYSLPSVLGSNASSEPWTAVSPAIATDEEFEEEVTTPVILSARVEGIQLLFDSVSGGKVFDKITAGQGDEQREETREIDVDRGCSSERQCWELVVEARAAYLKWSSACVALKQEREEESRRVGGNESEMYAVQAGEDLRVVEAADVAMDAMERILTFQDGWMCKSADTETPTTVRSLATSHAGLSGDHMDTSASEGGWGQGDDGSGGEQTGMIISHPRGGDGDDSAIDFETKAARQVAEARMRRAKEERESIARAEEAGRGLKETARAEEMNRVRSACLPGVVFLAHEVAHNTGKWLLKWTSADVAREWFVRCQQLANTVANDEYGTLQALSAEHITMLLQRVQRSSTKVLECDEETARESPERG